MQSIRCQKDEELVSNIRHQHCLMLFKRQFLIFGNQRNEWETVSTYRALKAQGRVHSPTLRTPTFCERERERTFNDTLAWETTGFSPDIITRWLRFKTLYCHSSHRLSVHVRTWLSRVKNEASRTTAVHPDRHSNTQSTPTPVLCTL